MRIFKKACALIYLVATAAALGYLGCLLYPPFAARASELMERLPVRIALAVCAGIAALGALIVAVRALAARREPQAVHPGGNPDIEVTIAALESTARAAAEREDVLVEAVRCRVVGADGATARFWIDAIAFTDQGLASLAARVQARVEQACNALIGMPSTRCTVRFLPSKTTVTIAAAEGAAGARDARASLSAPAPTADGAAMPTAADQGGTR